MKNHLQKISGFVFFLMTAIISSSVFAQYSQPVNVPAPTTTNAPQTIIAPQQPAANPGDIVKQHIASIGADIQNLRVCESGQNPSGCQINTKSFMDFAIYLSFCPQLKNWTVIYPTPGGFQFALSSTLSGFCQLTINFGALNLPSKSCILTQDQMSMMTTPQALSTLNAYDMGQVTGKDVDTYIKPITDCLGPPPARYEGMHPVPSPQK